MKERPILFSGPMVRAILAGAKTQTRRVVKPQPEMEMDGEICPDGSGGWGWIPVWPEGHRLAGRVLGYGQCPYGQPGDRLWVREAWGEGYTYGGEHACVFYRADDGCRLSLKQSTVAAGMSASTPPSSMRWRPSIHMPRWACRLVLEVVSVRVERLQEISEEDARAEGASIYDWEYDNGEGPESYREAFHCLWTKTYGAESWDANPWVWVIEFRKAAQAGEAK